MSEFEVTQARDDLESRVIREGIREADPNQGPWQYGHYVERMDRDGWTPLIYEKETLESAQDSVEYLRGLDRTGTIFRNSRVLRRAIGPWEVLDVEL